MKSRQICAGNVPPATEIPCTLVHRDLAARVADPDGGAEPRRVAAEPGVGMLLRRPGLAGGGLAVVGADAGAVLDVLLEDLRHRVGDAVRDHALALRLAPARALVLAGREDHLADRHRLGVDPARGERRVGGGHVERRDVHRAEADRGDEGAVDGERRADAELRRHLRDCLGRHVERQLGEDRVVRTERGPFDRRPAGVAVVVRLRAPPGAVLAVAVRVGPVEERRREIRRRFGVDPLLDRGGEHERLEGRAGLAPRLREQVELVLLVARDHRGHRADGAVLRVDRDHAGRRVVRLVERLLDRLLRRPLEARVDRRVDLEPAGADGAGAVLGDQLVADVAEEVGLADLLVELARLQAEPAARLPSRTAPRRSRPR